MLFWGFEQILTYREYEEPMKSLHKATNPIERSLVELRRRITLFRKFVNVSSAARII
jgi:hypothetical protein